MVWTNFATKICFWAINMFWVLKHLNWQFLTFYFPRISRKNVDKRRRNASKIAIYQMNIFTLNMMFSFILSSILNSKSYFCDAIVCQRSSTRMVLNLYFEIIIHSSTLQSDDYFLEFWSNNNTRTINIMSLDFLLKINIEKIKIRGKWVATPWHCKKENVVAIRSS